VPEFETTAQGSRVATSVGGVLTGRGADIIVIDDPLKPEESLSQTQRQAANEWYDHTLYSRLNDKLTGAIVLIMHRLHESLPSGVTRGTTSPATYWSRRSGRWCVSRRSPMTTSGTGSKRGKRSPPISVQPIAAGACGTAFQKSLSCPKKMRAPAASSRANRSSEACIASWSCAYRGSRRSRRVRQK